MRTLFVVFVVYFTEVILERAPTAAPTTAAPTLPPCPNPTSDNGEIVPEAVLKCGDSVSGDTSTRPKTGTGLADCDYDADDTRGVWYK